MILEAFSFGIPVIASRIGGAQELVENDKTGWLFEPGNMEGLENIIKNININNINIIKYNCLKKAEEYNLENYLDEYIKSCFN